MIKSVDGSTLKDIRDRALILVGFFGAFRRSELVGVARITDHKISQKWANTGEI